MTVFVGLIFAGFLLSTLGVLFAGLLGLARGGADPRRSNRLMRWRVMLQAGTLVMFLLFLHMMKS